MVLTRIMAELICSQDVYHFTNVKGEDKNTIVDVWLDYFDDDNSNGEKSKHSLLESVFALGTCFKHIPAKKKTFKQVYAVRRLQNQN